MSIKQDCRWAHEGLDKALYASYDDYLVGSFADLAALERFCLEKKIRIPGGITVIPDLSNQPNGR